MLKIKKELCLFRPEHIKSTSKKFKVIGVINPAAVRLPDGKIVLYIRVIEKLINNDDFKYRYSPRMIGKDKFIVKIDRFNKKDIVDGNDLDFVFKKGTKRLTFISHFRRVMMDKSGLQVLSIDKEPSFFGTRKDGELGVEDPRITKIDGKYVMTYVSLSRKYNISTALATSYDCKKWKREGIIFNDQDKDVVIFPERINGKYVAFDRPEGNFQFSPPRIWISYSNDLKSWGNLHPLECLYEEDKFCPRNGAGPPPIKTKRGWLLIYHAVTSHKMSKQDKKLLKKVEKIIEIQEENIKEITVYSVGAVLFDLKKPDKIIGKTKNFILVPKKDYDIGTFERKRVIFPTGLVIDENNRDILLYSGGGDRVTTVRKIGLNDILRHVRKK